MSLRAIRTHSKPTAVSLRNSTQQGCVDKMAVRVFPGTDSAVRDAYEFLT